MQIVVMGVSGAGKTVVGRALAARLALPYADGDAFHSAANIVKMHSGIPLDDVDRAPWLASIGAWLAQHADGVMSCSALRRRYRDRLREDAPRAVFVQLNVDPALLVERVEARREHFMPSSLVSSQLAIFEPLAADEAGVVVDNRAQTPVEIADRIIAALRR